VTDLPVLVVTNEADFAADSVIVGLHDRGVPVVRWNAETLTVGTVDWSPDECGRRFRSVWLRQYLPEPTSADSVAQLEDQLVVRAQWAAWIASIDDGRTPWMNPLWASRRAENKIEQLRTAVAAGFQVPATLVTNDLNRARGFAARHGGAVIKTVTAGYFPHTDQAFMFTTDLDDASGLSPDAFRMQPLVVQRRLTRAWDLRVLVVGGWVTAARARSEGPDWRLNPRVDWEPADIPQPVIAASIELVQRLGLRYAAIDLVDDGASLWFLEANQAGEFQFLDRPLKLGIAAAIADELTTPS
jgi:hypothetical protein